MSVACFNREFLRPMLSLRTRGPDSGKPKNHTGRELALPIFCRGGEINRRNRGSHPRAACSIHSCEPDGVTLERFPSPGLSFSHPQALGLFRVQSLAFETAGVLDLRA